MKTNREKQTVTYQGREYRRVEGACTSCPLTVGCHRKLKEAASFCGLLGTTLRETLRSRLSHWWHEWVKRNVIDNDPYDSDISTIDEVNARRTGGRS